MSDKIDEIQQRKAEQMKAQEEEITKLKEKFVIIQEMKPMLSLKCVNCRKTENVYRLPVQQVGKVVYSCFNCGMTFITSMDAMNKYEKDMVEKIMAPAEASLKETTK